MAFNLKCKASFKLKPHLKHIAHEWNLPCLYVYPYISRQNIKGTSYLKKFMKAVKFV